MNRLIEWLQIETFLLRSSGLGCIIVAFLCAFAAFTALEIANNSIGNEKTTPEIATIVGFGVYEGSWHGGDPVVSARDARGRIGSAMVDPSRITGCHIGDKIRAGAGNLEIYPYPAPCPIKLDPGEAETIGQK